MNRIVGADIGGANLKFASADGLSSSHPFAMWRKSDELASVLGKRLHTVGKISTLAVTMTGELADCFVDREEGVNHIVGHTMQAAKRLGIPKVVFYGVDGCFHEHDSLPDADTLAASNWHALASYVGTEIAPNGLLIDIGSTTCDIIPIREGKVATKAQTDHERLIEGSLVYVGCQRTSVCALVDQLIYGQTTCAVMNEHFATIDDARLVLGRVPEATHDLDTADGKPRTIDFATNRLARMIGLDKRTVTLAEGRELAEQVISAAKAVIREGIGRMWPRGNGPVICSGHAQDLLDLPSHDTTSIVLADEIGEGLSRCAPAYAVSKLWVASQET